MSDYATVRFAIHDPDELVTAVPYLLGFQPGKSIVVVGSDVDDDGVDTVTLVSRFDAPDASVTEVDIAKASAQVALAMTRTHATSASIIGTTDDWHTADKPMPYRPVVTALTDALAGRGIEVRESLFTDGASIWSYTCTDPTCHPVQGRVPARETKTLIAAKFSIEGVAPARSRQELVEELIGTTPDRLAEVEQALARRPEPAHNIERWRDITISRIHLALGARHRLDADEVATVIDGLGDTRVRDTIVWDLTQPRANTRSAADSLAQVVRESPRDRVGPAATVLAIQRWQLGDGTRAQIAIDIARAATSQDRLTEIVGKAVDAGLPPYEWRARIQRLPRDRMRHGAPSTPPSPSAPAGAAITPARTPAPMSLAS